MDWEDTGWVNGKGVDFVSVWILQFKTQHSHRHCLKSSPQSLNGGINPIKLFCLPVVFEFVPCHSPSYNTDQVHWGELFWRLIRKCFPQVTLQDQQRETSLLAKRLGLAAKENQDLAEWVCPPNVVFKTIYSTTKVRHCWTWHEGEGCVWGGRPK